MKYSMDQIRENIHHFFIPHHTNNHRAKVLHINSLFVYALVFTLFNLLTRLVTVYYPDILGYATDIQLDALLSTTNTKRQENGLPALALNSQLSAAAAAKASDMFAKGYWAHISPSGTTPWEFIKGAGYAYTVAGENLAKNFSDSGGVVEAWMNSPTHRENILKGNYKEVGFAIVNGVLNGEETTLVVQMFGTRSGSSVATAQKAAVKEVQASEPSKAPVPPTTAIISPTVLPTPTVVIPETAIAAAVPMNNDKDSSSLFKSFTQVTKHPVIDASALRHDVTLVFIGLLIGIFILDAYYASKKRVIRATGHTLAHVLFLIVLFISANAIIRGSVI